MRCDLFWLGAVSGLELGGVRVPVTALSRGEIHVDGGTDNRMYELDHGFPAQDPGARERAHRVESRIPLEAGQAACLTEFGSCPEHGNGSRQREAAVRQRGQPDQDAPGHRAGAHSSHLSGALQCRLRVLSR